MDLGISCILLMRVGVLWSFQRLMLRPFVGGLTEVPFARQYASLLFRGGFGKSAVTSHVVLLFRITSRRGMWNASHAGGIRAH